MTGKISAKQEVPFGSKPLFGTKLANDMGLSAKFVLRSKRSLVMVVLLSPVNLGEMRRKEQLNRAENLRVGSP
jgi:hypothetical protein